MISLKTFSGEIPRTAPHLLPDNAAKEAVDCDFTANILTGIQDTGDSISTGGSGLRSIFAYANSDSGSLTTKMYAWSADADVVRGPVANDAYDRMYWTAGPDYKVMVTRDALTGGGTTPDTNKTFLVGVPVPTLAPTAVTNGFTYNGARLTDVVALCETNTGTLTSSESIWSLGSVTEDTVNGIMGTFTYSPKCKLYSAASNSGGTQLPAGFSPTGVVSLHTGVTTLYGSYNFITQSNFAGYEMSGAGVSMPSYGFGGVEYVHYSDWAYAPLPDTLYRPIYGTREVQTQTWNGEGFVVGYATQSYVNSYVTLHHVGSGWYASNASVAPPSGTATGVATFAIRLYFGTDYVTLRETPERSTFVAAGYTGSFSYNNAGQITITMNATGANSSLIEQRLYAYTYVNIFGEESAPSPLLELPVKEGYSAAVTVFGLTSTDYAPITKIRLYRSATGSNTTELLFQSEVDNASVVVITDNTLTESLGEPVSTIGFYPPEDGLRGLQALPNGILFAFKNNEIHFSQPYLPYAWKKEDILTTADTVVGTCPAEGGFYVTTRSNPYFVSGLTPDAMSQMKMTAIQAGVSKGSICNIGPAVVWASHDGLVTANGGQASLDWSFKFFTRNDWRTRYGSKLDLIRINAHDGHLVCWFEDGTPGFLMRFDEVEPTFTKLSFGIYAATVHPKNDELYVATNGGVMAAFKHFGAARRSFVWESKDFVLPRPSNFGAVQVVGSGTVTVNVYADSVLRHFETVTLDELGMTVFRLPAGFLARKWSIRLAGTGTVTECNMAISPVEFSRG